MAPRLLSALFALLMGWSAALAADPLRVGLSPDYEPLAFLQDGTPAGIEVDNAREVAQYLDRSLELVPMAFEELFPALLAGRIDVVMSGISVSE